MLGFLPWLYALTSAQFSDYVNDHKLVLGDGDATDAIDLRDLAKSIPSLDLQSLSQAQNELGTKEKEEKEDGSVVDDFSREILELMGLDVGPDRAEGGGHPCEEDRKQYCATEKHWIACLAKKDQEVGLEDRCLDRISEALPFICRDNIADLCDVPSGGPIFQCLQTNFNNLDEACFESFVTTVMHIQKVKTASKGDLVHKTTGALMPVFGPDPPTAEYEEPSESFLRNAFYEFLDTVEALGTGRYIHLTVIFIVFCLMVYSSQVQEGLLYKTNLGRAYRRVLQRFGLQKKMVTRFQEAYGTV